MHHDQRHIEKIIKGCKKNKRKAQNAFYQLFYSYALSICMRYANDRDDAVEIMNDGFMKVFQYIKKFDTSKPIKPWLRRIMINSSIDHFKKHKATTTQEVSLDQAATTSFEPVDQASYDELLAIVRKLPPAYRTVFNLYAIEGYGHKEIATLLGISEGTSKSNYAKAKKKLQAYLDIFFELELKS